MGRFQKPPQQKTTDDVFLATDNTGAPAAVTWPKSARENCL